MSNLKIGDKVNFVLGTSLLTGTITKFYKNYYNREECSVKTEVGIYPHILLHRVSKIEDNLALDEKDKQIIDLQHRLDVAEKALNKMSNYAINDNDLYDLVSDFNIENERYDEDHLGIDTCDVIDYFKEQAEKKLKGEEDE